MSQKYIEEMLLSDDPKKANSSSDTDNSFSSTFVYRPTLQSSTLLKADTDIIYKIFGCSTSEVVYFRIEGPTNNCFSSLDTQ